MEPFADVIALLRPRAVGAKLIQGAGRWAVRYSRVDHAGFGLVLAGQAWLAVDGQPPILCAQGDFVLMPAVPGFVLASDLDLEPVEQEAARTIVRAATEARHGDPEGEAQFKQLGGYFQFEPSNIALLGGLLPGLIHIPAGAATERLAGVIALITQEALADRPGRDLIVDRLIEVLLVEALRFHSDSLGAAAHPGLLAGLADPCLARALRRLHADVAAHWTVAELAREAGLSRSAFSERFARKVGLPPMEYLIEWRMARARDLLRGGASSLETVAAAIGYQSASAFSTAFRRHVGQPPSGFVRGAAAPSGIAA
jgi:AraC-like DNA-binding protein